MMSLAKWASLLDDEGLDDAMCADELEELKAIRGESKVHGGISNGTMSAAGREHTGLDIDTMSTMPSPTSDFLTREHEKRQSVDSGDALNALSRLRDLSAHAIWSVSTAKAGNGVEQLLDGSSDTYWQSDGAQPHTISAQFSSKFKLSEVRLFLNYEQDESYTPSIISIRVGSSFHDLRVIYMNTELIKPHGWVTIHLGDSHLDDTLSDTDELPSDEDDLDMMTAGELAEREQRRRVRAQRRSFRAKAAAAKATQIARVARAARAAQAARSARTEDVRGSPGAVVNVVDGASYAPHDFTSAHAVAQSPVAGEEQQRVGLVAGTDYASTSEARERRKNKNFVRAHMLQIVIHCNHQNGRDSHVRQVKVLGPAQQVASNTSQFSSQLYKMYETIR